MPLCPDAQLLLFTLIARLQLKPYATTLVTIQTSSAAAKSAAEEAQAWTSEQDESETTMESAKIQLKRELVKIWQRQWDMQSEGRYTHNILPVVKLNRLKSVQHSNVLRQADARLNRLLSGNTLLKAHHLSQALNRRAGSDAST